MNFKIRAQRVVFNEASDWLIRMKFQRGLNVTLKCATPSLCHVVRKNHLISLRAFLRSFENAWCAIVRSRTHLVNFSFAFIFFFVFFPFSASMDDDSLMCTRRMRVNRFIVISQALDEFPPFRSFFGLKYFTYLGPILHACARPIYSCNITFRSAHHACSVTAPTIIMWSRGVDPFSESASYLNFCTTLKDSNKEQLFMVEEGKAWTERMRGSLLRAWSISRNVLKVSSTLTSLCLLEK